MILFDPKKPVEKRVKNVQSVVAITREQANNIAGRGRTDVMELIFQGGRLVNQVYTEV